MGPRTTRRHGGRGSQETLDRACPRHVRTDARERQLILAALVAALGCATTRQTHSAEPSGFLGDYSILEPGADGQAQLRFEKDMDYSAYHSMILESVTLWHEGSPSLTPEEQQALTDYTYAAFHDAFRRGFRMVQEPGDGVLRTRIALTEVTGARVLANAITTVLPQLRTLSRLGALATDQSFAAGRASLEAEILDSLTGERTPIRASLPGT